ncbi:MAG: cadherin repeat domain-containing protein, partial [Pseudomonadota bacterium]
MNENKSLDNGSRFIDGQDTDEEEKEILKEFGRGSQAPEADQTRSTLHYGPEFNGEIPFRTTDSGGLALTERFTVEVEDVNEGPTAVEMSGTTVAENAAGAVVGTLSVIDPDAGDSHQFTVSDDRFEVTDGQLRLRPGVTLDHEEAAQIQVEVTATDSGGLAHTETFTLEVEDINEGPTAVEISGTTVAENAAGAVVGTLSVIDPDAGDSHQFTVSDDRFEVEGGQLR